MVLSARGQIALEYLLVVAFAVGMIALGMAAFFRQSSEVAQESDIQKVELIAHEMLREAKQVYYAGGYSQTTLRYSIPNSVVVIAVPTSNELVFTVQTSEGMSDLTFFSDIPIEGSFPTDAAGTQEIASIVVQKNTSGMTAYFCSPNFGC